MKENDGLQKYTLLVLGSVFDGLFAQDKPPKRQQVDSKYMYRYEDKSIRQAIIQKLARLVTGLQAVVMLNRCGLLQEQATLQRTLDEFDQDIIFLCHAIIYHDRVELHDRYLDAFYQEEFDSPFNAIESSQKRPMVPRKKILAYISKDRGTGYDQSSTIEVTRTIDKLNSGYVHGASPQLMELYYGEPPRFHLFSSKESPYLEDYSDTILYYFYRAILTFSLSAMAFDNEPLYKKMCDISVEFAKASGREDELRKQ